MLVKRSGDLLNAREVNAINDQLALPVNGAGVVSGPGGQSILRKSHNGAAQREAANWCMGLNPVDGTDLPNFAPCDIIGGVYDGVTAQYKNALIISLAGVDVVPWGICGQAIGAGMAGRVYTSGIALVRIKTNPGDIYADIDASSDDFLTGDPDAGSAEILWEDGGPSLTIHLARVRFPILNTGAARVGIATANAISDANVASLSGTTTIDGVALAVDDVVLLTAQTSGADNGRWTVKSGAWTRAGTVTSGMLVTITGGSYINTLWILDTTGTIIVGTTVLTFARSGAPDVNVARAATTANITLSNTQTVDGVALSAGDICLVKNQSTGSQNGLYRVVSGGSWVKLPAPKAVMVSNGTVGGRLAFILTASNTWSPTYGVYA